MPREISGFITCCMGSVSVWDGCGSSLDYNVACHEWLDATVSVLIKKYSIVHYEGVIDASVFASEVKGQIISMSSGPNNFQS